MRELDCDVCVVGGGPGGLAAAVTAAEHGRAVVLVDDNRSQGGQIWRTSVAHGVPEAAQRFIDRAARSGVRSLHGTRIVDARGPRALLATAADGPSVLRAKHVVLALGASERFLPFPGWTLPGVCGVGGLQALVKGGLDVRGKRIAVGGSGPLLLAVAASLRTAGAQVLGLFEQAPKARVRRFGMRLLRHPRKLGQGVQLLAKLRGVPRHHDAWPVRAQGDDRLRRATFRTPRGELELDLDWLAVGFGLVPNTDVAALLGCDIDGERVVVDELTRTTVDGVLAVGETIGVAGVDAAIADGITAGLVTAGELQRAAAATRARFRERRFAHALDHAFALRAELRTLASPDTLVCRCEDVRFATIREHVDGREAKLMTRCGMGPCQGRVCGPALAFVADFARDRIRPPLMPLTFAEFAAFGDVASPPSSHPRSSP